MNTNQMLAGGIIHITTAAMDARSNDPTFTWEWGDGTPATANSYNNNGIGPDL